MPTSRTAQPFKLVIVESPVKAKTIKTYLGQGYQVFSCNGHIRDLPRKELAVDTKDSFRPHYVINEEKKEVVAQLSKLAHQAEEVLLASDDDREGESIAWHLKKALDLDHVKTKRIVFREITKKAIQEAVTHPRKINMDVVHSQQARRILDRLVGYDLSPLLWKKIKTGLSAGRVQTVAVRLVVERERAIRAFVPTASFQVAADFTLPGGVRLQGGLKTPLKSYEEAHDFLKSCQKAQFEITEVKKAAGTENPSAPFTTSTLQQAASSKLGYSVSRTMVLAQRLYEEGHITYMRTDSVNLSDEILSKAQKEILTHYGKEYHHLRRYKTKEKRAQEAHEAIRPTHIENKIVTQDSDLQRLYLLIWQRTLASQMAAVKLERTTAKIKPSTTNHTFIAKGEIVTFDGFLALHQDAAKKRAKALPRLEEGTKLSLLSMKAREHFSKSSEARYTEASLVRELEAKGIGRPSTYAPIIHTIQQRKYVVRESREGKERICRTIMLKQGKIATSEETETYGTEKNKLFPTDIALSVNDFLVKKFKDITDYQFTAHMEEKLDKIAHKEQQWQAMLEEFYTDFSPKVSKANEQDAGIDFVRTLGKDPATGKPVIARLSKRYGPLVQLGSLEAEEKPRFASLMNGQLLEDITLEQALFLFQLPRTVGTFEDAAIMAQIGRFGPYLKHQDKFYSLSKDHDVYTIKQKEAIEVIKEKRVAEAQSLLKTFPEEPTIQIRKGRWGPYIKAATGNFKINKELDPTKLTLEDCQKIISEAPPPRKRGGFKKRTKKK